jgi:SPP1 family predicted phage head-tail adaptor
LNQGRRDRKIVIEQPTYSVSDDTNDKPVTGWTTYKTVWAERVQKQSQEVFEAGQMVTKDTHQWNIVYNDAPAVKMDMRVNYGSEYYYLVGIKEIGRNESLSIVTVRRDN